MKTKKKTRATVITVLLILALGIWGSLANGAKAVSGDIPQFKYDAYWPKPLPEGWVLGSVGSVCVDANDHVFAVTRGQLLPKERGLARPAPPVIQLDAEGNL